MTKLTEEQYEQQVADCEGLCAITEEMLNTEPQLMRCVRCPFCLTTVNAVLTDDYIICPACKARAKR